jgi:probable rRNA maturation factor
MPRTAKRVSSRPPFSLAVQYASAADDVPQRQQFRRWVAAALQQQAQITLRIVDAEEGQLLNRDYRGKDYPTNVLTFAYGEEDGVLGGDIVLCAPVVEREAREQGKELRAHYAHLTVHGILHMQGYDHETPSEAHEMEAMEVEIMRRLRFNNPYDVSKQSEA